MQAVSVLAVLLLAAGACHAHLCMWHPMQRGNFSVQLPGEHQCYHKPPPCGGVPYSPADPVTILFAGLAYRMEFEQSLNHYYPQQPGFLDVGFAVGINPTEADFQPLGHVISDYNAMDMITSTNFSVEIRVPSHLPAGTQGVLRVRYASNNPGEEDQGTTFHQCANVVIDGRAQSTPRPPAAKDKSAERFQTAILPRFARAPKKTSPKPCCAAKSFTVRSTGSTGTAGAATRTMTYYDATAQQIRIDAMLGDGSGTTWGVSGLFQTFLNFTGNEIGHLYTPADGVCDARGNAYGPDPWNDWCYGGQDQHETYLETVVIGTTTTDIWQNDEFFFGVADDGSCTPVLLTRPTTGMISLFYDYTPGPVDSSVFVPPDACQQQQQSAAASRASTPAAAAAAGASDAGSPFAWLPRHLGRELLDFLRRD